MFNYPLEVGGVVRQQTFAIESHLSVAKTEDEEAPYKVYSHFSKFALAIIDKNKRVATANLPVIKVADVINRTKFAVTKQMDYECAPKATGTSPAYTVKIASGELKGKTPAEVLTENPDNKAALNKQYEFLKSNLAKFPRNQSQMDAIMDAANLLTAGKLEATESAPTPTITLYETTMRPLIRKTREDGKCFVYEVKITWNVGDEYPVNIEIVNYYAPVSKDAKGLLNVKVSEKDKSSEVRNSMKLMSDEWANIIREIETNMSQFEMIHAVSIFKDADACNQANKNASKGANAS